MERTAQTLDQIRREAIADTPFEIPDRLWEQMVAGAKRGGFNLTVDGESDPELFQWATKNQGSLEDRGFTIIHSPSFLRLGAWLTVSWRPRD